MSGDKSTERVINTKTKGEVRDKPGEYSSDEWLLGSVCVCVCVCMHPSIKT